MPRVRHRTSRAKLAVDPEVLMLLDIGPPRLRDAEAETERLRVTWAAWGSDLMAGAEPGAYAWALATFGPPR